MKKFHIILILSLISHLIFAQQKLDAPFLQSPNASSLGKFGKIDISPFTGLPNINIPVFSLSNGDININADLRHFGGGVKLEDHASWVGQNWSLNVGGIVTRKRNDAPDEIHFPFGYTNPDFASYFTNFGLMNSSLWDNAAHMKSLFNVPQNTLVSLSPDEFIFTLPNGRSGSFMRNHLGTWVVKSEQGGNLKVQEVHLSSPLPSQRLILNHASIEGLAQPLSQIIDRIVLRDDEGYVYTFGMQVGSNSLDAIEFIRASVGINAEPLTNVIANAWHLVHIKSPKGKTVNFKYERGQHQLIQNIEIGATLNVTLMPGYSSSETNPPSYSGYMITPSFLKEISCEAFKIVFEKEKSAEFKYPYSLSLKAATQSVKEQHSFNSFRYEDIIRGIGNKPIAQEYGRSLVEANLHTDFKLQNISVFDQNGKQKDKYVFTYNNDFHLLDDRRLFLTSFSKVGPIKIVEDVIYNETTRYKFKYDNELSLPGYNTLKVDEWGYYNGKSYPTAVTESSLTTKFLPDTNLVKIGSLTEIEYPTGGKTKFTYESNQYSHYLQKTPTAINLINTPGYGGGLRIRKIETSKEDGTFTTKNYLYKNSSGTSSGILAGHKSIYYVSQLSDVASATTVSYSGISDLNYTNGREVVYSEVKELLEDGSSIIYKYSNSDSTKYRDEAPPTYSTGVYFNDFTNASTSFAPSNSFPFASHTSREMERGKLLSKEIYSDQNKLVSKEINRYNSDPNRFNNYVRSYNRNFQTLYFGGTTQHVFQEKYTEPIKIYTYYPSLSSTAKYLYDTNGNLINSDLIRYNYNQYNVLSNEKTSNSKSDSVRTEYKYAFDLLPDAINSKMVDSNMVSIPLTKEIYINNNLIDSKSTIYSSQNTGLPLPYVTHTKVGQSIAESIYYHHDNASNLVEESRNNGAKNSYLWSYKNQHVVASANNAASNEFYHENFENSTISGIVTTAAHTGKKSLQQNNYTISWTKPNSRNYVYSYWYLDGGQWKFSTPQNYAGPTALSNGTHYDDISVYPSDAMVTTYTYDPLVGMTSEIDPKGLTTYYEYDLMNRLKHIKDQNRNIIKNFEYKYYNDYIGYPQVKVYYNTGKSVYMTKTCPSGQIGTAVRYTVERGKYSSTISEAIADQKQDEDINANAQRNANMLGGCSVTAPSGPYTNDLVTVYRTKNNCTGVGEKGSEVAFPVPAGTYTSAVSKNDANTQALNYANAQAQSYANTHGTCSVSAPSFNFTYSIPSPASFEVVFSNPTTGAFKEYWISDQNRTIPTLGSGFGTITIKDRDPQPSTYTFTLNGVVKKGPNAQFDNVSFNSAVDLVVARTSVYYYYNSQRSISKTKNTCGAGQTGSMVTYVVEAKKHSSAISQAAVNQLAQDDLDANAQAYANANGACPITPPPVTFSNTAITVPVVRNNCALPLNGAPISYTVAAGKYTSTDSQEAANQMALNDIANQGQEYANTYASCTTAPSGYFNFIVSTPTPSVFRIIFNYSNGGSREYIVHGQNITIPTPGSGVGSVTLIDLDPQVSSYAFNLNGSVINGPGAVFPNVSFNGPVTLSAVRTSTYYYYNFPRTISIVRNNCTLGRVGSPVPYTVEGKKYKTTVSQAAADQMAQDEVNTYGQALANEQGACLIKYFSTEINLTKTKVCPEGEVGSTLNYNLPANSFWSTISQADADQKAQVFAGVNSEGYINSYGTCVVPTVYYNAQQMVSRTKNNCQPYYAGTAVSYFIYANTVTSIISQADADQKALDLANAQAQAYANLNGTCNPINTYYSIQMSVTKSRNNCTVGQTAGTATYSSHAGKYTSFISQADANQKAQADLDANAQTYINTYGTCTNPTVYKNNYMQVSKTKNNCPAGQISYPVTYFVQQNTYSSTISQADANAKAQADLDANAQNYANTNGTCVLAPATISYSLPAKQYTVTITNASTAVATSHTISGSGSIPNIASASYIVYIEPVDFDGVSYVFTLGNSAPVTSEYASFGPVVLTGNVILNVSLPAAVYYNVAMSVAKTRNNCAVGEIGTSVTYNVAASAYSSTVSQAAANALAQADLDANSQSYANTNGTCSPPVTYYSVAKSVVKTRNNCTVGQNGSSVTYTSAAGKHTSIISQADADAKAQADLDANAQTYANTNGTCTAGTVYWNTIQASTALKKNNCPAGQTGGSSVFYYVYANTYSSTVSQAAANALAQADITANAQNYANANGTCISSTFSINYTIPAGTQYQVTVTNNTSGTTLNYTTSGTTGTINGIPIGLGYISIQELNATVGYYYNLDGTMYGTSQSGQFVAVKSSSATFGPMGLSGVRVLTITEDEY